MGKSSTHTFVTRSFLLHARDFAERRDDSIHSLDTSERFGGEDNGDTVSKLDQYSW